MKDFFPLLVSNPVDRCQPRGEVLFTCEFCKALCNLPGSSDLSRSRKRLYRKLVVGSTSDSRVEDFLTNSKFLLTWWLARNALSLANRAFKAGLADMPECLHCGSGLEKTDLQAFYYYERVRSFLELRLGVEGPHPSRTVSAARIWLCRGQC